MIQIRHGHVSNLNHFNMGTLTDRIMALKPLNIFKCVIFLGITIGIAHTETNNKSLQTDNSEVGLLKVMVHHLDMRVKKLELGSTAKHKRKVRHTLLQRE